MNMVWEKRFVSPSSSLDLSSFSGVLFVFGSEETGVTLFRFCCVDRVSSKGWKDRSADSFGPVATFIENVLSSSRTGCAFVARLLVLENQARALHDVQSKSRQSFEGGSLSTLVSIVGGACARLGVDFDSAVFDAENIDAVRVTSSPVALHVKRPREQLIRLMIVDDSASVRTLIRKMVTGVSDINIVGEASDPIEAEDLFAIAQPDVITLDLNMPRMDGMSYLRNLVARGFKGAIMITGAAAADSGKAIEALDIGAVDFLEKPQASALKVFAEALIEKIRVAAHVARAPSRGRGEIRVMPLKEQPVCKTHTSYFRSRPRSDCCHWCVYGGNGSSV